ncbi:thiamine diphosphokinase [Symbiobacterium terraclitae]|uniref:thiamine diphosphokinase n=1 Tax=Symbiobacterium terraclitae TaxID=557451 RepID=UPI0035B52D7E
MIRAAVFAAGQVYRLARVRRLVGRPDLVICADAGLRHARALGLRPDLLLGDFDSLPSELLQEARAEGVPILQVPVEKDKTDSEIALEEAVRRGAGEVILVGASGTRLDHTLANVHLLPASPVPVTMTDGRSIARILRGGESLTVPHETGAFLSLVPLTPTASGVTVRGVHWPLHGATLRWGETLGISNRIVDREAHVSVEEGCLLVVQAWD